MRTWVILFFALLAVGIAFGLARDLLSREQGNSTGTVLSFDAGWPRPKWLPGTPPHFTVRLADGAVVSVATTDPRGAPPGSEIRITEWVTPWGQVWYTQRD